MMQRILALQLKRIGDLILLSPALGALREAFPEAEVTLLCERSASGLRPAMPCHRSFARGDPGFWLAVWKGGFEACLDFTGSDRSAWIAIASRSRRRIGFARFKKNPLRSFAYNAFVDSDVKKRHTSDHYCDLLAGLGIKAEGTHPSLEWPLGASLRAKQLLESGGVKGRYVVIHPGTARPEKAWPAERWAEIAALVQSHGLAVVVTGANSPEERTQAREVCARVPGALDLSGSTSLLELGALIRAASLFCGVDSAAMHLADAAATPCVCLFGPTNPYHWQPRNTTASVLRAKTTLPFAPGQKGGPMDAIATPEVANAVTGLLDRAEQERPPSRAVSP